MQQQVYLLEQENKLLQSKEGEREALMGLELSDGQPLNEHMVQLKLKYEKCKRDLEAKINLMKNTEQENLSSINGLKIDNTKLTENCEQLKNKIDRTRKKMNEDDLGFRERKDEIDNEIERCRKTNKQAFTDLMEARSDINDNLNKKREVERKIEEENKKFKKIEEELVTKISDLNRKIAEAKYEKKSLELDKKDNLSIQKITN
jgi:chromosome segregation ATPase